MGKAAVGSVGVEGVFGLVGPVGVEGVEGSVGVVGVVGVVGDVGEIGLSHPAKARVNTIIKTKIIVNNVFVFIYSPYGLSLNSSKRQRFKISHSTKNRNDAKHFF